MVLKEENKAEGIAILISSFSYILSTSDGTRLSTGCDETQEHLFIPFSSPPSCVA